MLAFDLVEQRGSHFGLAVVEPALGLPVQRFHVARDIGGVTGAVVAARTSGGEKRRTRKRGAEDELGGGAGLGCHGKQPITSVPMNAK